MPVPAHCRAALVAAGLCLALTACGSDVPSVSDLTPGDVSVDTEKDGTVNVTGESEDGSFSVSTDGDLPDGFPVDAVPLVDGRVQSALAMDSQGQPGFSVVMVVDSADHDAAVALLTAKGYSVEGSFTGGGTWTTQLASAQWDVLVSTADAAGTVTVSYTVAAPV